MSVPRPHSKMPSDNGRPRTTVDELARKVRSETIPVNDRFSYFLVMPVAEEDLRQYIQDPISALPPAVSKMLPKVTLVLAPWLEKTSAKSTVAVVYEKPIEAKLALSTRISTADSVTMFFTVKDEQVADYHYFLFDEIAGVIADRWTPEVEEGFSRLIREELAADVHGEVDERSWHAKQTLIRRGPKAKREGKPFKDYVKSSFTDTMTLYLHGICCDIDVETGPRQLPSRYLRRRLLVLKDLFPPPEGQPVFPEDIKN